MKTDLDYLKKLIDAFEDAPAPYTDIDELSEAGLDYRSDQFVFHMNILEDQRFIERDDHRPGYGMVLSADRMQSWSVIPLRLTAGGHQFAEALRNKGVFAQLKKSFAEAGPKTLVSVSLELLAGFTKQQIKAALGGG